MNKGLSYPRLVVAELAPGEVEVRRGPAARDGQVFVVSVPRVEQLGPMVVARDAIREAGTEGRGVGAAVRRRACPRHAKAPLTVQRLKRHVHVDVVDRR